MKKRLLVILLISMLLINVCSNYESLKFDGTNQSLLESKGNLSLTNSEYIKDYDTENIITYTNSSGNKVIDIYSIPMEKDNSLITSQESCYTSIGSYANKEFPKTLSKNNPIIIRDKNSFDIKIFPNTEDEYIAHTEEKTNIFGQKKQAVAYSGVFGKGINYNCFVTPLGINSEIILKNKNELNDFKIDISLPDLTPDTGSPDYILFKSADNSDIKAIIYTPLAIDSKGSWCYNNTVKLVTKDISTGLYTIEYTLDDTFLKDVNTAYPVTINSSVCVYKSKQSDTSLYEKTDESSGYYLSPYLMLGNDQNRGIGVALIRYEALKSLNISKDDIISAKYIFTNLIDLKKEATIGIYAIKENWCSINTRWFSRPEFDEKPISEVKVTSRGEYELDITPLIKEMIKNKNATNAEYSIRNSFLIKSNEIDTSFLLASGDNSLFSPLLEIELRD